ncbi:MAG: type III-B CRISPR-associated protein Cas10/Cmr2 [Planctomycetaceae bacterium]|nr:type III-B CRISPR-associated protein Cas10/Cmr2 [Planctomycetaceae bacterium]
MSKKHLLAISLGPVQGFIAAARKTRDLWFGSFLLSDIAKKTAKKIYESGGELIFPGVENVAQLDDDEIDKDENFSVANVILAVVENPSEVAKQAEAAAKQAWNMRVETAKKKVEEYGNNILRQDIWDKQKDDFVECYAAWVPYENESDYKTQRQRVMKILAGRKALRDFKPEAITNACLPKSSLDGARDTVLNETLPKHLTDNLHIRRGEQLDLIGVVKRFGGGRKKFSSLGEIAVNPVLPVRAEGFSADEVDDEDQDFSKCPYLAVICADGDKMGAAISQLDSPDKHKAFSLALTKFSQDVKNIVKKDHHGALVYAGGDDVLAFVPVDEVLPCARELSESFKQALSAYKNVSLSVGVVIGHYHEMLETLLEFARQAEKKAKTKNKGKENDDPIYGDRNGLAISMYHRGNAECSVREQWTGNIDERITCWAELFKDNVIPRKFPYDLRTLKDLYNGVKLPENDLADCLKKQLHAAAKHKQIHEAKAQELYAAFGNIQTVDDAEKLVNEMLIAQMIGEVQNKRDKALKGDRDA